MDLAPPPQIPASPPALVDDLGWMNGTNRQPESLLRFGPVTLSMYADVYYQWHFGNPRDHTVFQTTVAPRHNEISVNLASFGVEVSGLKGPIGRVVVQYGANVETNVGQDPTTGRGFFLTHQAFNYIQQAAAGWHFDVLKGINIEAGIFLSYMGIDSYLPQENWNYLRPFTSDFTPYYMAGIRSQFFFTDAVRLELWLLNGWQTLGQWHEARAGGYLVNYKPREWLSLTTCGFVGQEVQDDPKAVRFYSNNHVQLRYYAARSKTAALQSAAFYGVGDLGYEHRETAQGGILTGGVIGHRLTFRYGFATALRGDIYYDQTQAIIAKPPGGAALSDGGPFLAGGVALTQDYSPSPWLLLRLEYVHRNANLPYFSGPAGVSGQKNAPPIPGEPNLPFVPALRRSDDRLVVNATLRL